MCNTDQSNVWTQNEQRKSRVPQPITRAVANNLLHLTECCAKTAAKNITVLRLVENIIALV